MFHEVLNTSLIIISEYVSVFFYFYIFHFESIKFRSRRSQMSFERDVFKSFTIFTGKHLCWSLFVIKFPAFKPANLLKKRLQHRYFHINIAKFLRTAFFIEHLRQLLFKAIFETCQNLTMKNKKDFY